MCITPKITESFILSELKNASSFDATNHLGSRPNGYTQVLSKRWALSPVYLIILELIRNNSNNY